MQTRPRLLLLLLAATCPAAAFATPAAHHAAVPAMVVPAGAQPPLPFHYAHPGRLD